MTGTGSHGELSVMPRTQFPGRHLPGLVMQVVLAPQPCRSQALVSAPPAVLYQGPPAPLGPQVRPQWPGDLPHLAL